MHTFEVCLYKYMFYAFHEQACAIAITAKHLICAYVALTCTHLLQCCTYRHTHTHTHAHLLRRWALNRRPLRGREPLCGRSEEAEVKEAGGLMLPRVLWELR